MEPNLVLPLTWKGEELELPLQIVPQGYTYRFIVRIGEVDMSIEQDDGGELRALINNPEAHKGALPDTELIAAVVRVIRLLNEH